MQDDLISRKDALASIKNLYPDMPIVDIFRARRKWLEKYAPYFECENAIEQLPPVNSQEPSRDMEEIEEIINCDADAETKCKMISNILTDKPHYFEKQEPKTGHWIKTISENGVTSAVRCSECGFEDNRYMLFRYCPNCGAIMVEPQESEE